MLHRVTSWIFLTLTFGVAFCSSSAMAGTVTIAWDANNESDLAGYRVHYGTQSNGNYDDLVDVGNVTSYQVINLDAGKTYFFVVTAYDNSGNESNFSSQVNATIPNTPQPNAPPQLVGVTPLGQTQIDVVFSKELDEATATTRTNYSISNSIQVLGAILGSNQSTVHLITSTHETDRNYTLSVSNVEDRSGAIIAPGSSRNYSIAGSPNPGDTSPPQMTYVAVVTTAELDVIFNEPVQRSSAENAANYSTTNGVQILQAQVGATSSIIKLTTSQHQPGANYTLSVSSVRDGAGNPVTANSSLQYQVPESGGTDNSAPQITSVMVKGGTQIDVNFNELVDKATAEDKGNFSINKNIQILGAVLDANNVTVHLLTSNHANGDYVLTVNRVRDLASNQIGANSRRNYTVENANEDDGGPSDPNPVNPNNFALFQNYPNPFNPDTEIRFYLEKVRKIELKVYNQLGQLVKKLVADEMQPGHHSIMWDGTNSDGIQVPTGVYIYSLEVTREVLQGDLLVNVAMERRVKKMTLIR